MQISFIVLLNNRTITYTFQLGVFNKKAFFLNPPASNRRDLKKKSTFLCRFSGSKGFHATDKTNTITRFFRSEKIPFELPVFRPALHWVSAKSENITQPAKIPFQPALITPTVFLYWFFDYMHQEISPFPCKQSTKEE